MRITQRECVFVALGFQHAMSMRHIVMWSAPLYNIFPHHLISSTILEKRLPNTKCVFLFSLQRLSETFLILKRTERDMIKKKAYSFSLLHILMKFAFSRQIIEKSSNIKLHENPSTGCRVVSRRRA
jgi:hypothetical protein